MTLTAALAPLAAYAVIFQTVLYMALPSRLRMRVAPLLAGLTGGVVAVGAGTVFGFHRVGIVGGNSVGAVATGLLTVLLVTILGLIMLRRDDLRRHLADPRLASMSRREAIGQILFRIPLFTVLIEEAVFRGVLHAALIAVYPTDVAIWLGAGLFGLWHIGPGIDQAQAADKPALQGATHAVLTVLATTMAGAFLVWLRIETGSIWAPVAVHAGVNMTTAIFARLAARTDVVPAGQLRRSAFISAL